MQTLNTVLKLEINVLIFHNFTQFFLHQEYIFTKLIAAPLATLDTSFLVIEPHIMPDYLNKQIHFFKYILKSSQLKIIIIKTIIDQSCY